MVEGVEVLQTQQEVTNLDGVQEVDTMDTQTNNTKEEPTEVALTEAE